MIIIDRSTFSSSFFFIGVTSRVPVQWTSINLYYYKYENVCLLYNFFSGISKPIWMPFGSQLLFVHGKFLKQQYDCYATQTRRTF